MSKVHCSFIALAVVALATIVVLTACDIITVTPKDRLASFLVELSKADRSNVKGNLDPSATQYNNANAAFWDAVFPNDGTYSSANIDDKDPANLTAGITGTGTFGTQTVTFNMQKSGGVYYIKGITFGGRTWFN